MTNAYERENRTTYSDLVIVTLVLHVLIKLFLWVKLDPHNLQLFSYLKSNTKLGNKQTKNPKHLMALYVINLHLGPAFKSHVHSTHWKVFGIYSLSNSGISGRYKY